MHSNLGNRCSSFKSSRSFCSFSLCCLSLPDLLMWKIKSELGLRILRNELREVATLMLLKFGIVLTLRIMGYFHVFSYEENYVTTYLKDIKIGYELFFVMHVLFCIRSINALLWNENLFSFLKHRFSYWQVKRVRDTKSYCFIYKYFWMLFFFVKYVFIQWTYCILKNTENI